MIVNRNPVTGQTGFCLAVGRAAVGIYLSLLESNCTTGHVLVPGNICYAAVFPAIYAGLTPKFCDVEPRSGNVTLNTVMAAYDPSVCVAIIPHMYGNPVAELPEIQKFLKNQGCLLIEDCASAMGAESASYSVGTMGDFVVYSTGSAKTLDIGFGGLLFSRTYSLEYAQKIKKTFPAYKEENGREIALFSKLYRLLRNEGSNTSLARMIYQNLGMACRNDFLFHIPNEKEAEIFDAITKLQEIIACRKYKCCLYEKYLPSGKFDLYRYEEGAVPWRFNLYVPAADRKRWIQRCLDAGLPVSDWYPNVTEFFGEKLPLVGVDWQEAHILNFPLMIGDEEIQNICGLLNTFSEEIVDRTRE